MLDDLRTGQFGGGLGVIGVQNAAARSAGVHGHVGQVVSGRGHAVDLGAQSGNLLLALAELADFVVVDSAASADPVGVLQVLAPYSRQVIDFAYPGDMIALGRSLLLVGSQADIERRIAEIARSNDIAIIESQANCGG